MAELLVNLRSVTHWNVEKQKRGCYTPGDVVVVMPDGHTWGSEELNTEKFAIVKIPGVTPQEVDAEAVRLYGATLTDPQVDLNGNTVRRRLLRIDIGEPARSSRQGLAAAGETVDSQAWQSLIRRK